MEKEEIEAAGNGLSELIDSYEELGEKITGKSNDGD